MLAQSHVGFWPHIQKIAKQVENKDGAVLPVAWARLVDICCHITTWSILETPCMLTGQDSVLLYLL